MKCASALARTKIKLWNKLSYDQLRVKYSIPVESLLLRDVGPALSHGGVLDIDGIIGCIIDILTTCAKAIPTSSYRSNKKPYWNKELTALKRIKVKKFNMWKAAGRPRGKDNSLFIEQKVAKNNFGRELRRLSRGYDNEQIVEAATAAQLDHNAFWCIVKRSRTNSGSNINATRNKSKQVVHENMNFKRI